MNGSQAQLEFLPERSTDFIFAVIGEEFGLLGLVVLLLLYLFVVSRALYLATQTQDTFARLLAGSLALTFFVYVFINTGMVSGLLPVVGVPLPLVSYGGTSVVTLLAGLRYSHGAVFTPETHRLVVESLTPCAACGTRAARPLLAQRAGAAAFDLKRPDIAAFVSEVAARDGMSKKEVRTLLQGREPQPKIIELMNRPPRRWRPGGSTAIASSPRSASRRACSSGTSTRSRWSASAPSTRCPPSTWWRSSGSRPSTAACIGQYRVLDALTTLAFDYPPRSDFFRERTGAVPAARARGTGSIR